MEKSKKYSTLFEEMIERETSAEGDILNNSEISDI
jgi:hypothetical protein